MDLDANNAFPQKKILLCTFGDPYSRATFSGTANNLLNALDAKGCLLGALDADKRPPNLILQLVWLAMKRLSRIYYQRSHFDMKGRWSRYGRAEFVRYYASSIHAEHVLHVTPLSLPAMVKDRKRKHYLFIDSTWDSWRRYADDLASYPARLIRDIEACDRLSFQQADHIFTTASYLRDNLIEHYGIAPGKITPVGTGSGSIVPFFGPKDYANRTILFVAKNRFSQKGRLLTIEAFRKAVRQDPRLRLIVAGDPAFAAPPDIANIEIKGFVDLKELQYLFESSSLFVLPASNEPWGLVYIEALLCRMPIVGLRRNALPEIAADGSFGFLLNETNSEKAVDELAGVFLAAFSDLNLLAFKGQEGQRACLSRYTWMKVASSIMSVVDSMAGDSAPPNHMLNSE